MDSHSGFPIHYNNSDEQKINVDKPVTLFSMQVAYAGIWPVDYAVVTRVSIACAGEAWSAHISVFKLVLDGIP